MFKKFKAEFMALEDDGATLRTFKDDKKKGANLNFPLSVSHTSIYNIYTSIYNIYTSIYNIYTSHYNIYASIYNIYTSIYLVMYKCSSKSR